MNLNLLSYQDKIQTKKQNGKLWVRDSIRNKYLVLSPEEHVRQLLVLFLIENGYNKNRIAIEREVRVNGMPKRFDILIYAQDLSPFMLIECKSPKVKINQQVIDQVAVYNMSLKVPYLCVSNGLDTRIYQINYINKTYVSLENFPHFK